MTAEQLSIWVTAAATIATAVATAVLAMVTWLLFTATKRMAAATSEPYVVATLEPSRWSFIHMDLLIENTGSGPAFDVQVSFDPPLMRDRQGKRIAVPLNGIAVLRPSQTLRDFVGDGASFLQNTYRVAISWKASPKSPLRISNSYNLDLKQYESLVQLGGGDPQVQMAQELKKLREGVDRIAQGSRRLAIDVYTKQDREREGEEQESWLSQATHELGQSVAGAAPEPAPND